jgi:hypothetical protein
MANLTWPAANSKLLAVNAPGSQDDYGDVAAAGADIWTGSIDAALRRERQAVEIGGEMTTIERDILVVRKPPAALANLTPGDQQSAHTVLVEDRRATTFVQRRWHVVDVENRASGHESDSLRLELRDPR